MKIRYLFEQDFFPKLFAKDPVKVINKVITEKGEYVFKLMRAYYMDKSEEFPYSLTSFSVDVKSKNGFDFINIEMPKTDIEIGNCHNIILVYSFNYDLFEYYTVEEGYNKNGSFKSLSAWIENSHISFGDLDKDDIIDRILTTLEI